MSLVALGPDLFLLRGQKAFNFRVQKLNVAPASFLHARAQDDVTLREGQLVHDSLTQAVFVEEAAALHEPDHRVIDRQVFPKAVAQVVLWWRDRIVFYRLSFHIELLLKFLGNACILHFLVLLMKPPG